MKQGKSVTVQNFWFSMDHQVFTKSEQTLCLYAKSDEVEKKVFDIKFGVALCGST